MGGILKNKGVEVDVPEDSKAFREQVLKNTQLNAKLQSEEHHRHTVIASAAAASTAPTSDDKLQWNKQNLADNEVIQQQIMENMETSIDEPKTPFQHATELNEYYKDDDDDELEDFSLGAPELDDGKGTKHVHVGVQVQGTMDHVLDSAKHMSFEEKKKMHYHHEAPQFHPVDDDEEETETAEPQQKKMSFAEMRKMHYSKEFEHANAEEDDDAGDDADEE